MSLSYEAVAIRTSHSRPTYIAQHFTESYKRMSDSLSHVLLKDNFSDNTHTMEHLNSVLVDIKALSRKTMKEVWDNDEDEFWDSQ